MDPRTEDAAGVRTIQRTYLGLMLLTTLSASLIWGINTLFLLEAGLNNLQAFAANAFFTAGMVVFEIPTGIVADLRGRRTSFMLGAGVIAVGTLAYVLMWWLEGPFWAWALVSVLLGLGFTFFSGATEAWLVDALTDAGYTGELDAVFGRGQAVTGVAMLGGSVLGGVIAQATNLGVPFLLRFVLLAATVVVAGIFMHDRGFTPATGKRPGPEMQRLLRDSLTYGLGQRPVRWVMLTSPFVGGVGIYAFYAMQPYLLELYGDPNAYGLAGLAAAIVAGSQIVGGLLAPRLRRRLPPADVDAPGRDVPDGPGPARGRARRQPRRRHRAARPVGPGVRGSHARCGRPTSTPSSRRSSGPPCCRSTHCCRRRAAWSCSRSSAGWPTCRATG